MTETQDLGGGFIGTIRDNPGGGDCFYYAVAEQIGVDMHRLRAMLAEKIESENKDASDYIFPDSGAGLGHDRIARKESFGNVGDMIASIKGDVRTRIKWANMQVIGNMCIFLQKRLHRRLIIYKDWRYYDHNPLNEGATVLENGVSDIRDDYIVIIHSAGDGGGGIHDHYRAMIVTKGGAAAGGGGGGESKRSGRGGGIDTYTKYWGAWEKRAKRKSQFLLVL
jgi:hypothetical protein